MDTATAHQQIEQAQREIARLELEAAEIRRTGLISQLANIRQEYREGLERYEQLSRQIKQARQDRRNIQDRINATLAALNESFSRRPPVFEILPNDPEVQQWQKHHDEIAARKDSLIAKRDALGDPDSGPDFVEACQLEGPLGRLTMLQRAEHNILRMLKPGTPQASIGGVR